MKQIWSFFDRLEARMRGLGAICLMGMVALTCSDIIGRAFGNPIFGSEEIVSFLLTLVLALSLPYAHMEKVHVGVEIVFRLLPVPVRVILSLITNIFSLVLMILITVMMYDYFAETRETGEVSMNLEFPEYTIILALTFGFFILNFFILRDIIELFNVRKSIERFIEEEKKKGGV